MLYASEAQMLKDMPYGSLSTVWVQFQYNFSTVWVQFQYTIFFDGSLAVNLNSTLKCRAEYWVLSWRTLNSEHALYGLYRTISLYNTLFVFVYMREYTKYFLCLQRIAHNTFQSIFKHSWNRFKRVNSLLAFDSTINSR